MNISCSEYWFILYNTQIYSQVWCPCSVLAKTVQCNTEGVTRAMLTPSWMAYLDSTRTCPLASSLSASLEPSRQETLAQPLWLREITDGVTHKTQTDPNQAQRGSGAQDTQTPRLRLDPWLRLARSPDTPDAWIRESVSSDPLVGLTPGSASPSRPIPWHARHLG